VLRAVKVLGRVLVRGAIATPHVSTTQAEAEVDPLTADLQTVFAAIRRRVDVPNLRNMLALTHDEHLPGHCRLNGK
jgi:hypothetical protein